MPYILIRGFSVFIQCSTVNEISVIIIIDMRLLFRTSRRAFLKFAALLGASGFLSQEGVFAENSAADADSLITSAIPSTGEKVPVIGMGTWVTFDVGHEPVLRESRCAILKRFFKLGGRIIDSSPMYGYSENVIGHCLKYTGKSDLFSATKVWTPFQNLGISQIEDSYRLWGLKTFDLYQVHNLVAFEKHLETLLEMKSNGQLRYIGVTTSHGRRHDDLERIILTAPIDFVQLTYNVLDREAERRLLPAAQERGLGVMINRPFRRAQLFHQFAHHPLPVWASEFDCANWAQFFLKYIVSHPAVTCAIPATSQMPHLLENMGAQRGRLPDTSMRKKMTDYVEQLA